jgi:hypothetical protein
MAAVHHRVQNGTGTQTDFYAVGTVGVSLGIKYPESVAEVMPPLPHSSSRHGSLTIKSKGSITFTMLHVLEEQGDDSTHTKK